MKDRSVSRLAFVGVAAVVLLVIAVSATSQTQQRVQTTTQLTVRTPVVAGPLVEWEKQYAETLKATADLAESGSPEHAERLENDLRALDRALREYVGASERLRHKDRAMAETMEFLSVQTSSQNFSQIKSMMANLKRAMRDVEMSLIDNIRG